MRNFIIFVGLAIAGSLIVYTINSNKIIATQKFNANVDEAKTIRIDLHKVVASYTGAAKADFLKHMAPDLLPAERKLFMEVLLEGISHDDQVTNEELLKVLKELKLKNDEYKSMAKSFCEISKRSPDLRLNQLLVDAFTSVQIKFEQECL